MGADLFPCCVEAAQQCSARPFLELARVGHADARDVDVGLIIVDRAHLALAHVRAPELGGYHFSILSSSLHVPHIRGGKFWACLKKRKRNGKKFAKKIRTFECVSRVQAHTSQRPLNRQKRPRCALGKPAKGLKLATPPWLRQDFGLFWLNLLRTAVLEEQKPGQQKKPLQNLLVTAQKPGRRE